MKYINEFRSKDIEKIVENLPYRCDKLSVAIIDLKSDNPAIFGVNLDQFIYPASCYKVFIAAEALRQVAGGLLSLDEKVTVKSPNDVDKDSRIFPGDNRPLLFKNDVITIDYLMDLMLTRSDNTASNCLIDIVGRESITKNIISLYNWQGSEVTRKFLDRIKENEQYRFSDTTMSCARHLAEFFYLVEKKELVSPFVSEKLKSYMLNFKGNRPGLYLKQYESFYRKGGWLENNLWSKDEEIARKTIQEKNWAVIRWHNDAGVIKTKKTHYAIAVMSLAKTISPNKYFDMTNLAEKILLYMENQTTSG